SSVLTSRERLASVASLSCGIVPPVVATVPFREYLAPLGERPNDSDQRLKSRGAQRDGRQEMTMLALPSVTAGEPPASFTEWSCRAAGRDSPRRRVRPGAPSACF